MIYNDNIVWTLMLGLMLSVISKTVNHKSAFVHFQADIVSDHTVDILER